MNTRHFFPVMLLLLLSSGIAAPAQTEPVTKSIAADTQSAQALFEEANNYVARKYEEFNQKKIGFDQKLEAATNQEQKELAARNATTLAGRGSLAGDDLYYLGMLYHLAGNSAPSLDALRRFLAHRTDGQLAQNARAAVVVHSLRVNLIAEAEATVDDYVQHKPQNNLELYGMQTLVTDAFFKQKDYERTIKHAAEMLTRAKLITGIDNNPFKRDDRLFKSVTFLAEAYRRLGKKDQAVGAVENLRRLAVALPSGNLFRMATRKLFELDPTADPLKALEQVDESAGIFPPELVTAQWIDQAPGKLADFRGKVVLIDFWAPWCGPCRFTFPKLKAWHEKYRDQGFMILGLTHYYGQAEGRPLNNNQELAYLREFKKKNYLPYGIAVAPSSVNDFNYGVYSIPMSFLIDRQGRVRFIALGAGEEQTSALGKMIKKILEEPPAETDAESGKVRDGEKKADAGSQQEGKINH